MSVFSRIFARKDPREQAREAYDRVVALGREPYWYLDGGVPDSVDGRFETVMTVLCAVLLRLEGTMPTARCGTFRSIWPNCSSTTWTVSFARTAWAT